MEACPGSLASKTYFSGFGKKVLNSGYWRLTLPGCRSLLQMAEKKLPLGLKTGGGVGEEPPQKATTLLSTVLATQQVV